ncbi:hypothetical protein JDW15_01635 [Aerococcaceae bacterium zg-ZJ1578]|uniref:hypothetical protein n=1 Tax=Aerococcaceae bacterium zg-252 TaxID=2796928 RepID=UPI001A339B95|nr:hypothetical protein [Aerococcaceae bacterium zg-1578]
MKKKLLLTSSIMTLSLVSGINPSFTFQQPKGIVYAQEMTPELEYLKSWLIAGTPLTEDMWDSLPLSEWERYRVGYIDVPNPAKFFEAAVTQHPAEFKPFVENIKHELITQHNIPEAKVYSVDDVKLLWAYESYQRFSDFSSIEDALGINTTSESSSSSQTEVLTPPQLPDRAGAEQKVNRSHLDKMIPDFLKMVGVSDDIIKNIPADTFYEGAVSYYLTHITGGDYGTISAYFMSIFPDYFTSASEVLTPPQLPDRAGAEQKVNRSHLDKMIPDFLKMVGVSDDIIKNIPADTFYEGAVSYYLTHITGGDYGTISAYFMSIFPDYFTSASEVDTKEQQQQLEKIQKNQEKILTAITKENKNILDLKSDLHFSLENEEYTIKRVFLLVPGEAGNQSDHYLLGINYDYQNKSEKEVQSSQRTLLTHSSFTQKNDVWTDTLITGKYELKQAEESADKMSEPTAIKPGETVNDTVYFTFNNGQNDILWSMAQTDKVVNYRINVMDLQKMPYQSASYTIVESDDQLGYIFDFNKLYLVYQSTANLEPWKNNTNVTIEPQLESLSPEAMIQLKQFKETLGTDDIQLVELNDVTYTTTNDATIVQIKENKSLQLTFKTNDFWKQFEDYAQHIANLIPFK